MTLFLKKITLICLLFFVTAQSIAAENAFYLLRTVTKNKTNVSSTALESLNNNAKKINLLIMQAYYIDAKGTVKGAVDQTTLDLANKYHIKKIALVTNSDFDRNKAHLFLKNKKAQTKALQTLLTLCKTHQFDGVQIDFEAISLSDKTALTNFLTTLANLFHQNKFSVSFAVIPLATDDTKSSAFLKRKYERWGGAYDLKALSQIADFITLMSYDQHEDGTTPGPYAGLPWVAATIQYALRFMPADKISLGIPVYSGHWSTKNTSGKSTGTIRVNASDYTFNQVNQLLKKLNLKLTWDNFNKVNSVVFQRNWLNEYLFVEDADSFKEKIALVKKYHLRGISVFDLGIEDPKIWEVL